MVAIGTDRITKEGNLVSNVPSSSNQMAKQGELFSSEQQPKPLDNTGHGKTFYLQLQVETSLLFFNVCGLMIALIN